MKSIKGITLIALVITIIILILLAGVSISILTGDDGLITKAKMGAQNYQNAAVEEQGMLNTIGIYTDLNGETNGVGMNIKTKEGTTITPSTEDIVIPAGTYLTGDQVIKGDSNLKKEYIKDGISIFGITGTAPGETTHTLTKDLAATDTETIDLGVNHSYRYVNVAEVYNAGKNSLNEEIFTLSCSCSAKTNSSASATSSETFTPSHTIKKVYIKSISGTGFNTYCRTGLYSVNYSINDDNTITASMSIMTHNSGSYSPEYQTGSITLTIAAVY